MNTQVLIASINGRQVGLLEAVVGMRSIPGNMYDSHTLAETLAQVEILADRVPTATNSAI